MSPIEFPEHNCRYAKNQPEYSQLPAHKTPDGTVTTCWELTLKERLKVLFSGVVWLQLMTFNQSLQPTKMTVYKKDFEQELKED